jgi:hypothetical protein
VSVCVCFFYSSLISVVCCFHVFFPTDLNQQFESVS